MKARTVCLLLIPLLFLSPKANAMFGWHLVERQEFKGKTRTVKIRRDSANPDYYRVEATIEDRKRCMNFFTNTCGTASHSLYTGRFLASELQSNSVTLQEFGVRNKSERFWVSPANLKSAVGKLGGSTQVKSQPRPEPKKSSTRTSARETSPAALLTGQQPCELTAEEQAKVEEIYRQSVPYQFGKKPQHRNFSREDRVALRTIASQNSSCIFLKGELTSLSKVDLDDVYNTQCTWRNGPESYSSNASGGCRGNKVCTGTVVCDLKPKYVPPQAITAKGLKPTRISFSSVACGAHKGSCNRDPKSCIEDEGLIKFSGFGADSPTSERFQRAQAEGEK